MYATSKVLASKIQEGIFLLGRIRKNNDVQVPQCIHRMESQLTYHGFPNCDVSPVIFSCVSFGGKVAGGVNEPLKSLAMNPS